jgi:hypothetical protein
LLDPGLFYALGFREGPMPEADFRELGMPETGFSENSPSRQLGE